MPTQFHRLFESLESRTLLHAGDIDPAFNSGQLQTTAFPNSTASASVVDPLPDGGFLVGGAIFQKSHANDQTNGDYQQAGIGIAKYNFDGTLDTTFGDSGEVSGTPRGLFYMQQIVNTPDGGFLVLGYTTDSTPLLIKYTAAGQIDTTFAKNGKLSPDSFTGVTASVAVDSAGRILVPGTNNNNAVLRRYLASGTLDTSFCTNGDYTEDANPHSKGFDFYERIFTNVAVGSDGEIVVSGDENLHQIDPDDDISDSIISSKPIVREVTRNGTPVKQFDSNVDTDTFPTESAENVAAILPNGNIVLDGGNLIVMQPDGHFDAAYGEDDGISDVVPDGPVAVQQDGSIISPLRSTSATTSEFALRRILPNGRLDYNFGHRSEIVLSSTNNFGNPLDVGVAIAPDGTVLAASQAGGISSSGKVDTRQFEIARVFTAAGPAVQLIPRTIKSNTPSIKVTALIRDDDGVDTLTLDNHDLKVLDPANVSGENFFQRMHFVSSTQIDGDKYIQATYKVSSPNLTIPEAIPTWDSVDNGTYQIRLAGSQIDDVLSNAAEAQTLGTITVEIPTTA